MFRASKITTRYDHGNKITQQLDINAEVNPPAKIDIVINDDQHGISFRLNKETTSPRAFFIVSFAGGLPDQLKSATETYCKAVGMENLSSEKKSRSIVTHMAYGNSYTSNYFSLYFAILENCIYDCLKIEDRTSSESLEINGVLDSLRYHLGLPKKSEEVDRYIFDAQYFRLSPSNYEKCMESASQAISLLMLKKDKTTSDFLRLATVYECLANINSGNNKLLLTFNFAKDFFAGGEIDMVAFKELNFYYHQSGLNLPNHIDMYLKMLKCIAASYTQVSLPHSVLKEELQNGDYKRFSTVVMQWEALSLLGSSSISSNDNCIFNSKPYTNRRQDIDSESARVAKKRLGV